MSGDAMIQVEEIKRQNQELIEQNDSLMTQRKSLQKAREGLQKDLTKVLKEKDQLDGLHQQHVEEIVNKHEFE